MRALKAGVIYFLLVSAVGWILGPILSCRNGQGRTVTLVWGLSKGRQCDKGESGLGTMLDFDTLPAGTTPNRRLK